MTPIKWFRKNNKKLLAVFGVLLMVGFLLPSFTGVGKQSQIDQIYGYMVDQDGQEIEISMSQIREKAIHLQALRELGLDAVVQSRNYRSPIICQLPDLGEIGPLPAVASSLLFFGEGDYNRMMRRFLRQQAEHLAEGPEEVKELRECADQLAGCEPGRAGLYYLLLAEEARRMGVLATDEQIDQIFNVRRQLIDAKYLRPVSVSSILSEYHITEKELRAAVGDIISILRYAQAATKGPALSEAQLRKKIRDQAELETVAGTYIIFHSGSFREDVKAPGEEEMQRQFEAYKTSEAGNYSDENPFGFGYLLPDRVQVEYLKVDLSNAGQVVMTEFAKLPVQQQEEKLQQYWTDNKEQFRLPVAPEDIDPCDPAAPKYRDPDFDEVFSKAQTSWRRQQGIDKAKDVLAEARRLARAKPSAKDKAGKDVDKQDNTGGGDYVDYAEIATKLSGGGLSVNYGKTEFFPQNDMPSKLQFNYTYQSRRGVPQRALPDILFDCEALRQGTVNRLDVPPVQLFEDITSLMLVDYARRPISAYMVRVVAADKQREPLSMNDDGSAGAFDQTATAEQSQLREKIKSDIEGKVAHEMAMEQAERFAKDGGSDWQKALDAANESMKDPCMPGMKTYNESTLQSTRDRLERISEILNKNPQMASRYMSRIVEGSTLLEKAMKSAQDHDAETSELAVLELQERDSCLVFKDLSVTCPNEDEYRRRRPLVAREIMMKKQSALSLVHFNPVNIDVRSGFREATASDDGTE